MGVMGCARKGCENIMCERYSPEFGYLCNECFEELYAKDPVTYKGIKGFMVSLKNPVEFRQPIEYYEKIFPIEW